MSDILMFILAFVLCFLLQLGLLFELSKRYGVVEVMTEVERIYEIDERGLRVEVENNYRYSDGSIGVKIIKKQGRE